MLSMRTALVNDSATLQKFRLASGDLLLLDRRCFV